MEEKMKRIKTFKETESGGNLYRETWNKVEKQLSKKVPKHVGH